jgi:hypothetical protein
MTKNILFIDDEKDITLTIKMILEQTGLYHGNSKSSSWDHRSVGL